MQLNVEKLQCFNAFIVLFTLAVKTINVVSCPSDCNCRSTSVKCNPGQTAWPFVLDQTTTVLSLSGLPSKHNTLHHIQQANVQQVTQLITLRVTYSEVNTIDDGAFAGLNELRELSIADNDLSSLNGGVSRGLTRLRTLDISGNHYCQFDKTLFTHIKSIEELNLGDMKISKLSPDIFAYLNNLRVLKLYSNHLKRLNASVLGPLTSLTMLDLSDNLFCDLPKTLKRKLNSLTTLYLSDNPWSCHCQLYWFHDLKPEFLVSGRDGGEVVCNGPARVKYHAFINVPNTDFKCKPPKGLHCDSQLYRIDVHHKLSINCEFEGNPIPEVKWTSPSGVSFLEAGTRSGQYSILDNGTLVINGVGKTDDGQWTFEVNNGTASDNVTVRVEVTGITTTTLSTPSSSTSTSTTIAFTTTTTTTSPTTTTTTTTATPTTTSSTTITSTVLPSTPTKKSSTSTITSPNTPPSTKGGSTTYQSGLSKTATYTTPKLALLTTQNPTSLRTKTPELRTTNFMITSITPAHSHLLPQQAIHTACEPDKWNITINMMIMMSIYPGIQKDDIYLGNFACKGTMESNMILVFDQGLQNCSTVETKTPHSLKFVNKLVYAQHNPVFTFIIRRHFWDLNVECDVPRDATANAHMHHDGQHFTDSINTPPPEHSSVSLVFYRDQTYSQSLTGPPFHISVGETVYGKVFTETQDNDIKLVLRSCYMKPYKETPEEQSYYIIKNGCVTDQKTHIISYSQHEVRFVFEEIEYTNNKEGLDIYCKASLCDNNDYTSSCDQSCHGSAIIG